MEIFDSYFRRADLDHDGRISGNEAVAFFQGSNLPKHVLAQIWMHADQNRTGFLGRTEFHNALRLVTVAQSGRELTPDMVKAALFGPAAAKIPPPQINPVSVSAVQLRPVSVPTSQLGSSARPPPQMGVLSPTQQNLGVRGPQVLPNAGINYQVPPSSNNQFMRPQATPSAASFTVLGVNQASSGGGNMAAPRPLISNPPSLSTDWLGSSTSGAVAGGLSLSATTPGLPPKPQSPSAVATPGSLRPSNPVLSPLRPAVDSRSLVPSGNGFSPGSIFGRDTFSSSQAKPGTISSSYSANTMPNASTATPLTVSSPNSNKPVQADPFQGFSVLSHGGSQIQQAQSHVKQKQPDMTHSIPTPGASHSTVGPANSAASQAQPQWPKITQSDIKKYYNVFVEVDKDRDGKITGEQARNLFLSWRLPREVLKQVWDLSDQDNDSMLSLREFCIALYLMERYREGRPLPAMLPNSLMYDETLLQATGQPSTAYGGPSWQTSPGFPQQGIPGARPVMLASGVRPPMQTSVASVADGGLQPPQQKSRGPIFGNNLSNQAKEEHDISTSKFQEATEEVNKVEEMKILDSREKIEFYRTKMQDLVLYKSRCDNRLNEITERASADKREVESLAKKYEEKYKQVADVASKLTVEEATFRDVQERKLELQSAIVKIEQGGSVDGLLQVRADRIQSDFEELAKALNERCKHHGINVKTTASIELPFGWQPGIQEGAVDWDEEWDKFEDDGFSLAKELSAENVAKPANKSPTKGNTEEGSPFASSSRVYSNSGERLAENGSEYDHSEDGSARSPPSSPGRSAFESPSQEFHSPMHDLSPHARDSQSDHGGAESAFSGDRFGDDSWGAHFDANDDVDSVWGFNAKDSGQNSLYGSGDFGLNPIKIYSPSASSDFGKGKSSFFADSVDSPSASSEFGKGKKSLFFEDSVPSSPLFNSASPRFSEGFDSRSFDSSSRYDSFSMQGSGFSQQRETFARFDSIRSTSDFGQSSSDFGHSHGYSFDDTDPFGSTGPFKSTETPRKSTDDNWNAL